MAQIIGITSLAPPRQYVELLQRALEMYGEMNVDDVCQSITHGKAQLWTVQDNDTDEVYASALTEVIEYPRSTAVRVIAVGGERMDAWMDRLLVVLYDFCRHVGATRIEAICRPGLERMLKSLGVGKRAVCIYKEVPGNGR